LGSSEDVSSLLTLVGRSSWTYLPRLLAEILAVWDLLSFFFGKLFLCLPRPPPLAFLQTDLALQDRWWTLLSFFAFLRFQLFFDLPRSTLLSDRFPARMPMIYHRTPTHSRCQPSPRFPFIFFCDRFRKMKLSLILLVSQCILTSFPSGGIAEAPSPPIFRRSSCWPIFASFALQPGIFPTLYLFSKLFFLSQDTR